MLRLSLFLIMATLMLTPLFWWVVILAVFYIFYYTGYELIVLAILVDGYFGAFYNIPIITIITTALFLFINLLKPTLLMYTNDNEMVS